MTPTLSAAVARRTYTVRKARKRAAKAAPVWPVQPTDRAEMRELEAYLSRVRATDVTRHLVLAAFAQVTL